ncbi:MAG: Lrp/AsnC ligand binding domain-containing protein [Nitrososphaeria archaeon]
MARAFVLITVETGSEDEVLTKLRNMKRVKAAYLVYGIYDLIANVEAETVEELKDAVLTEVRGLEKVASTVTLIEVTPQ